MSAWRPSLARDPDVVGGGWLGWVVALVVCAVFLPALAFDFVGYDDNLYVARNDFVRRGLTWEGLRWAWTAVEGNYWLPLTRISYLADTALFGVGARGYHLSNLLLHALNAALLFELFRRCTGRRGPAVLAALLFALHPLRVEAVAWVSSRKELLAACWVLVCALLHVSRVARGDRVAGALLPLALVAALLSKPVAVVVPPLLLVLDFWPLARVRGDGGARGGWSRLGRRLLVLCAEKWVLFVLCACVAALTVWLHPSRGLPGGLGGWVEVIPRVALNIVEYVRWHLWPIGLSAHHARAGGIWVAGGWMAMLALCGIGWWLWRARVRWPYLLAGGLWFAIGLLPVIGLVRVGTIDLAERYTYLPSMGLSVALVWFCADPMWGERARRAWVIGGGVALLACVVLTLLRLPDWRDGARLFESVLRVDPRDADAMLGLGRILEGRGRVGEAMALYERARATRPGMWEAEVNRANLLAGSGRIGEAIAILECELSRRPDHAVVASNLGALLVRAGRVEEGIARLRGAVAGDPTLVDARLNLATALLVAGEARQAVAEVEEVIRGRPFDRGARVLAAEAYRLLGERGAEAKHRAVAERLAR